MAVTVSLAGRTTAPAAQAAPVRIGGFGGAEGLAAISRHRAHRRAYRRDASLCRDHLGQCCRGGGSRHAYPLLALRRPPWAPLPGDRWTEVADTAAAVQALGEAPRRVFLALGRNEIGHFKRAPQHYYLVRSVEPVDPPLAVPHASYVTGRGPFTEADDRSLLAAHAHRRRRRQEQRRHCDLRQDRGGARARPPRHHAASPGPARRSRQSRPSMRPSTWLDHALAPGRPRRIDERSVARPRHEACLRRTDDEQGRHVRVRRVGGFQRRDGDGLVRSADSTAEYEWASSPAGGAAIARRPQQAAMAEPAKSDCRAR